MKNSKLWKPEGLEGRDVHDSGLHPFENVSILVLHRELLLTLNNLVVVLLLVPPIIQHRLS